MEDIDCVRKVKNGDVEAYSFLVEKYHQQLLNFIYRLVDDENSVEDIGQEVFFNVYKSIKDFDEERGTPISAWLFITARNRCISELRKKTYRNIPLEDIKELKAHDDTAEEALLSREKLEAVEHSLQQLPEPYKNTIIRSLQGDSIEDIAHSEGISKGTVKSRLFRAREKIKIFVRDSLRGKEYERI